MRAAPPVMRVEPVAPVAPPAAPPPVVVQAPPPPPAPKPVEVIVSRCEERLRVGSDFLFDFDRAEVRPEAEIALHEVALRIQAVRKAVLIEGHTDSKGTESYNQTLSERRAGAVRAALAGRGLPAEWLRVRGHGESRPVVPNERADGADDPDGRQRNRRVEVVINTCS
jgi:outer membrane protein OmpA-like peptidoglycan-associated protein